MRDRIGTLDLHYGSPAGRPWAVAQVGGIGRALEAGLPGALAARLAAAANARDETVVVVRELVADAPLSATDPALDAHAVETVCRATVDALATICRGGASEDQVVRFTDEAEYVGSFIVDLIDGVAWDAWYYGTFRIFRRGDCAATLRELLQSPEYDQVAVRDWLVRAGEWDRVCGITGMPEPAPDRAADAAPGAAAASGTDALIDAAVRLLAALDLPLPDAEARLRAREALRIGGHAAPAWSDPQAVVRWMLDWMRDVCPSMKDRPVTPAQARAIRELLAGDLDWLNGEWLLGGLGCSSDAHDHPATPEASRHPQADRGMPSAAARSRPLSPEHSRALEHLARWIDDRSLQVEPGWEPRRIATHLRQALLAHGIATADDQLFGHLLTVIATDLHAEHRRRTAAASSPAPTAPGRRVENELDRAATSPGHSRPARSGEAAARALREAILKSSADPSPSVETTGGGLYLMTRAFLDLRVDALVTASGLDAGALRAALARKWLDLAPPFDDAVALWVGGARTGVEALDRPAPLRHVVDALIVRRLPGSESPASPLVTPYPAAAELGPSSNGLLDEIATLVLQAWSRWLPGMSGASPAFLIERCLRRSAECRISASRVHCALAPAALDVVLEMAGYLQPIEQVPWLGDRSIRFSICRRPPDGRP